MRQQSALDLRQALRNAGKANDLLGGNMLDQEIFWPVAVIDDYAFNATPYEALAVSPANIGVVIGVTRDEATLFLQSAGNSNPDSLASYQEAVKQALPGLDDADVLFITTVLYPLIDYGSYSNALADVMGDVFFACPSVATADVLAGGGHSVRFYQFSRKIQDELLLPVVVGPLDPNAPDLGVPHSAELFYLWDLAVMQAGPLPGLTVKAMQQYWSRFAASGVPTGDDQPGWPLYSIDGGEYLDIGLEIIDDNGFKLEKCDFLNSRQIR
jgi:carboxylesterase type B